MRGAMGTGSALRVGRRQRDIAELLRSGNVRHRAIQFICLCTALASPRLEAHSTDFAGGTGSPRHPYQIATAEQLISIGSDPYLLDMCFVLVADIDLDPNLPGGRVFDRAVIAPDNDPNRINIQGTPFAGVFDGNGHTVSHLTIRGGSYVGLFGWLDVGAEIKRLGVVDVDIAGSGEKVGGLVGGNGRVDEGGGTITECFSSGAVCGHDEVGGLVGHNFIGAVTDCYSTATVSGDRCVGGLAGRNGTLHRSYGDRDICYSGTISNCYATGAVSGTSRTGGLVGVYESECGPVTSSFWDIETSGQTDSYGGTGQTTAEMQRPQTFLDAGWDFVDETANGTKDIWRINDGMDDPRLAWERSGKYGGGTGEPNHPYLIYTAEQMDAIGAEPNDWDKHFKLIADISLSAFDGKQGRPAFHIIGSSSREFTGTFDGQGHSMDGLVFMGNDAHGVGLFGFIGPGSEVSNLTVWAGLVGEIYVGPLVGYSRGGTVRNCHATRGYVHATQYAGGLIGMCTEGTLVQCCSSKTFVDGTQGPSGGLIGANSGSTILQCAARGPIEGGEHTGGIAGEQSGSSLIQDSYSACSVRATSTESWATAGIVGHNETGTVSRCYSTGLIRGGGAAGGLVAVNADGKVEASFWDTQTSKQAQSAGGTGKTTAEMRTASTFLEAGWDFAVETVNGTEDIWRIDEGKDYPRLWWERSDDSTP